MADLPDRLPLPLSERLAGAASAIYSHMGREVDVAIGGIPFRLATSQELAHTIETIPVRKEQFDTETDPGEQSLTGWWRRSQSSFHEGAGFLYEPTNAEAFNGFWDSSGIDVWTPGRLSLLRVMEAWGATGTSLDLANLRLRNIGGSATSNADGSLYSLASDGTATELYDVDANVGVGVKATDGMVVGTQLYVATDNGKLSTAVTSTPTSDTVWTLGGIATGMGWAKHRLWLFGGQMIWQPDLSLADGAAQTPIYTNPTSGFGYTCMAEGPAAVYFAGDDGITSSIQAISLDADGSLPTLSGATVVATLPKGERITCLEVLASQFIGIGTTQGFRVGIINDNGAITYGPLTIAQDPTSTANYQGCTALTTFERFFVVGIGQTGGTATAYRVDTSTQVSEGVFAYAKDIEVPSVTGHFISLASTALLPRMAALTSDGAPWMQDVEEVVSSGWIQTSRIRYRTTEPKAFKYVDFDIEPLAGTIAVDLIREGGTTFPLGTLDKQGEIMTDPLGIDAAPMRYASLKLSLTKSAGGASPVVASFLVRALPAVKPQRLITLPLLCFDREQAKTGQRYGNDGYALDRVMALQTLEDQATSLVYQDFTIPGSPGRVVTIESLRFVQTSPPAKEGPGGILIAQLRTVD